MPNINRIIRGIECCLTMLHDKGCEKSDCNLCPYNEHDVDKEEENNLYCIANLFEDLHGLLKVQEPNEDWISRKRLKDEIQYYIDEAGWGDEVNKVLGWCMEFIDNQRAVKWDA